MKKMEEKWKQIIAFMKSIDIIWGENVIFVLVIEEKTIIINIIN